MGRIRKQKLSWKPPESGLVRNYRLYWSKETPVSYSSKFIKLGNITEVNLPDILLDVAPSGESIYLGISAVDQAGNESDIISLPEPYHPSVPPAPADLVLTSLEDYKVTEPQKKAENHDQDQQTSDNLITDQEIRSNPLRPSTKIITTEGRIVDNLSYSIRKALQD